MTPLAYLTQEEIENLLVECCEFLDADKVFSALRRGLTGEELARVHIHLMNSLED